MAVYPRANQLRVTEELNIDYATTNSTSLLPSDGLWDEVVASTAESCHEILFVPNYGGSVSTRQRFEIDIAVGALGSEQIIAEKLLYDSNQNARDNHKKWTLPISIPAGSRIAIRANHLESSTRDIYYFMYLFGGAASASASYSVCERIGAVTLNVGATAHTMTGYGEIVASAAHSYSKIYVDVANSNTSFLRHGHFVDIAVGALDSEQGIAKGLPFRNSDDRICAFGPHGPMSVPISRGARVSARMQSRETVSGQRDFTVYLWGLR